MAITGINVGTLPNDNTGDSIRDAFVKANNNFEFLDLARLNLFTGNFTANGNISLQASGPSYWSGGPYFIDGVEIATVGTTFSGGTVANPTTFQSTTPSSSNVTGAVVIAGGLGVQGAAQLSSVFGKDLVIESSISAATLQIGGAVSMPASVATGNVTTSGFVSATGNVSAGSTIDAANKRSVAAFFGSFLEVSGVLQTAAQINITQLGNLVALAVTGNITAANLTLSGTGNIVAANARISSAVSTNTLQVAATAAVIGNVTAGNVTAGIGQFNNATVDSIPTVKSVTTKEYVTATVVGFAIGLGS